MDITCYVGCLGLGCLVFCLAVSYSISALDFRFLLPFVLSALSVAAVALIEEQIEVEFILLMYDSVVNGSARTRAYSPLIIRSYQL
jgi:hypothetical protein